MEGAETPNAGAAAKAVRIADEDFQCGFGGGDNPFSPDTDLKRPAGTRVSGASRDSWTSRSDD
jgi:hypothetical protein